MRVGSGCGVEPRLSFHHPPACPIVDLHWEHAFIDIPVSVNRRPRSRLQARKEQFVYAATWRRCRHHTNGWRPGWGLLPQGTRGFTSGQMGRNGLRGRDLRLGRQSLSRSSGSLGLDGINYPAGARAARVKVPVSNNCISVAVCRLTMLHASYIQAKARRG